MSVKPDSWIRKMSKKFGMINPFVENQVSKGVISYGVSSYGYDVRVGKDFKVFTNTYGATVDPKAFDSKSFVDISTETHCTIPPNSFALAQTVEQFKIPRNVITLCVGKSTYARCFRGDTRVALVDGSSVSLEDMARRADKGEKFWGYSMGPYGRIIVTLLESPRFIGRDSLLEIVLDNKESIFCTPDHIFFTRDGREIEAGQMKPGQSLMPLYRQVARGYEMVYQPIDGHLYPTHRLADEWNLQHQVYEDTKNTHRHHLSEKQKARAIKFWHDRKYASTREKMLLNRRNPTMETRMAHRRATLKRFSDPIERFRQSRLMYEAWTRDEGPRRLKQREIARNINIRNEFSADMIRKALDETGSIRATARSLQCDRSVFRRFPQVIHDFKGTRINHKVESIREVAGTHDVYCLTVPEVGNFALESGVFVGNCGIIVNVTPFEPEWEGFVTLEISNTTPLPAKIYANEGIAQVLFFESDEVCETSYADKKGKYQKQSSITLPKVTALTA